MGETGDQDELMGYEQAMKEISHNELTTGKMMSLGGVPCFIAVFHLFRSHVQNDAREPVKETRRRKGRCVRQ